MRPNTSATTSAETRNTKTSEFKGLPPACWADSTAAVGVGVFTLCSGLRVGVTDGLAVGGGVAVGVGVGGMAWRV